MSQTPEGIDLEEKYFSEEDKLKLQKIKAEMEAEAAARSAADLKALHHLHCGKCGAKMDTQLFRGVEIEVCPSCGAVLLDPGELEALAGADKAGLLETVTDFFSFSKRKG